MIAGYEDHNETPLSLGMKYSKVLSHALRVIRTHPLLSNAKRIHIWDRCDTLTHRQFSRIAREAAELFEFVDPLEELVLDVNNLRPFLSPFFDFPELQVPTEQGTFPSIKGLAIAERAGKPFDEECVAAIVELVKLQHMRSAPSKRVVFHTKFPPVGMAERLELWVGTVHFSEERISGDNQVPV
jgi:hypothetical protein